VEERHRVGSPEVVRGLRDRAAPDRGWPLLADGPAAPVSAVL